MVLAAVRISESFECFPAIRVAPELSHRRLSSLQLLFVTLLPLILACHQLLVHCFINNASQEDGKQGQSPPPASLGVQRGGPVDVSPL